MTNVMDTPPLAAMGAARLRTLLQPGPRPGIVQIGDPALRTQVAPWTDPNRGKRRKLARLMDQVMRDFNGVGLAGPQIGLPLSVFVYDDKLSNRGAVFNAEVHDVPDAPKVRREEGCLSCVDHAWRQLQRPDAVLLVGEDADGKPVRLAARGFIARIFQHETDHLQGVLYLDRASVTT